MSKKIALFSGGRGNKNLLNSFISDLDQKNIELSVIVNGLDDGASTGKIRYLFSKETHGISDFLKVILSLSPNNEIVKLFERRFPTTGSEKEKRILHEKIERFLDNEKLFILEDDYQIDKNSEDLIRSSILDLINHFNESEEKDIDFSDFKIGNVVFASQIIKNNFDFKLAIFDFSQLVDVDPENSKIIESSKIPAYLCGIFVITNLKRSRSMSR